MHRTKDDPPTGGQGRSHDGKMLIVGAIELGDGNIPGRLRAGRNLLLRRRPTSDSFVETAADPDAIAKTRRLDPATGRSPPIATMSMSSGRPPLTSSCPGSTKSSPTSKAWARGVYHGLRRKHLHGLSRMSSSFASTAAKPATLLSTLALPPRHVNAEPLTYSMLIEPRAMCISRFKLRSTHPPRSPDFYLCLLKRNRLIYQGFPWQPRRCATICSVAVSH